MAILSPGTLMRDPVSAVSLALGACFGLLGMPHILMRFFTVPDAREARKSVVYASGFVGYFFLLVCILGLAGIAIVGTNPAYFQNGDLQGTLLGGNNMVALHLANAVGGNLLLGFLSAVAFATILAVVAGLALAGAAAVGHDLYANVFHNGHVSEASELRVTRLATVGIGIVAVVLGILFKGQNLAFLVALAFGIAASSNFPVLVLAMYWKGLTTRGAIAGGLTGLLSAVVLVVLGPAVWKTVLGHDHAIFPWDNPALFSMPAAFLMAWIVSKADARAVTPERIAAFERQYVQAHTGLGAATASKH